MNEEKTKEKKSGGMAEFWHKASDVGKKVASGVATGTKNLAEKAKEYKHEQDLKKYRPITMAEYKSESFRIPTVIKIVDDSSKRDDEMYAEAIGWRETVNEVEILCLYHEYANKIGIQFVPMADYDGVYCADRFDETKFLEASLAFRRATDEKLAELANIAYCLGAKSCSIEIVEIDSSVVKEKQKVNGNIHGISASASQEFAHHTEKRTSGKTVKYFEGTNEIRKPNLKWFAHDSNINGLIEMRCSNQNSIKSNVLELLGSASNTMSRKIACAIDGISKMKGSLSMESQAIKEQSSKLIFEVEF